MPILRIHLRFSLRILLLFTLLIGFLLVPFCIKLNKARNQKALVEEIQRRGGSVFYEWEQRHFDHEPMMVIEDIRNRYKPKETLLRRYLGSDFFDGVTSVSVGGDRSPDPLPRNPSRRTSNEDFDFHRLSHLDNLTTLSLSGSSIDSLPSISGLSELTYLDLSATKIRDIDGIGSHRNLKGLSLYGTEVRDISPVSNLPELKILDISHTKVVSLEVLRKCNKLEILGMSNLEIDDYSPLLDLASLKHLVLSEQSQDQNKRIMKMLKKSNPGIEIRDEFTPPSDSQWRSVRK